MGWQTEITVFDQDLARRMAIINSHERTGKDLEDCLSMFVQRSLGFPQRGISWIYWDTVKLWRIRNSERVRDVRNRWRSKNIERVREISKKSARKRKAKIHNYYLMNADRIKERVVKWKKAKRDLKRVTRILLIYSLWYS